MAAAWLKMAATFGCSYAREQTADLLVLADAEIKDELKIVVAHLCELTAAAGFESFYVDETLVQLGIDSLQVSEGDNAGACLNRWRTIAVGLTRAHATRKSQCARSRCTQRQLRSQSGRRQPPKSQQKSSSAASAARIVAACRTRLAASSIYAPRTC